VKFNMRLPLYFWPHPIYKERERERETERDRERQRERQRHGDINRMQYPVIV